jgi:hypothetical protein
VIRGDELLMKKNDFLNLYLKVPDKKNIRGFAIGVTLLTNLINYIFLDLFYRSVFKTPIDNDANLLFLYIILIFDIWSLIILTIPQKMAKQIYLYTAIAFVGSSIFYMYLANRIIFHEYKNPISLLIISLSILIYLILVILVIFNIRNKIKNNFSKKYNTQLGILLTSLGITIGIILSKQTKLDQIPLIIILYVLAYCLALTSSGFHKFYLIIKFSKNENQQW